MTEPALINRQVRLVRRPAGLPGPECWDVTDEPVPLAQPGEVVVEVAYLSVDPGLRGWISEGGSYVDAVPLGSVMKAFGVGRVIRSTVEKVKPGAIVTGLLGVQEYAVLDADDVSETGYPDVPLPRLLGALGISGISAYLGLVGVARPEPGSTVLVSGAAGSVGSLAGQIARIRGCRVIGIAGGAAKCAWLTETLGFHATIDYKNADVGESLRVMAPDGVDVYFDNVGGSLLDTVLESLAINGVVVLSGTVSQWGMSDWAGLRNHRQLLIKRARMEGFLVFDHEAEFDFARREIELLIRNGDLVAHEEVVPGGVAAFPDAFRGLFVGDNLGKRVVEVAGG
ncbi:MULTISPECIES: NADP-dependent oxidoreductase [Microbacterium]|uniref:Enoyl reductase (ER) domain-containing protein n=1 Tax=Microbacterium saccharophilum TaxID=1213358 RepID=A0A7Z7D0V2_9MICO|nr:MULTISPECIES: NADP-dependent oxidoreductase [Microbacterium]SFI61471.1 hypothetical protein SAMN04487751_2397 [Microbacterium saccharophilum]